MIDDNYEVSGLVDWEFSRPLPLGVGFGRIHTLAGEYTERKFYMPPSFEEAERGFWDEIWNGIPAHVRTKVDPEALQTAVLVGTLLDSGHVHRTWHLCTPFPHACCPLRLTLFPVRPTSPIYTVLLLNTIYVLRSKVLFLNLPFFKTSFP
jgi:hypothetical protein